MNKNKKQDFKKLENSVCCANLAEIVISYKFFIVFCTFFVPFIYLMFFFVVPHYEARVMYEKTDSYEKLLKASSFTFNTYNDDLVYKKTKTLLKTYQIRDNFEVLFSNSCHDKDTCYEDFFDSIEFEKTYIKFKFKDREKSIKTFYNLFNFLQNTLIKEIVSDGSANLKNDYILYERLLLECKLKLKLKDFEKCVQNSELSISLAKNRLEFLDSLEKNTNPTSKASFDYYYRIKLIKIKQLIPLYQTIGLSILGLVLSIFIVSLKEALKNDKINRKYLHL